VVDHGSPLDWQPCAFHAIGCYVDLLDTDCCAIDGGVNTDDGGWPGPVLFTSLQHCSPGFSGGLQALLPLLLCTTAAHGTAALAENIETSPAMVLLMQQRCHFWVVGPCTSFVCL
jgi:hypothetical protein